MQSQQLYAGNLCICFFNCFPTLLIRQTSFEFICNVLWLTHSQAFILLLKMQKITLILLLIYSAALSLKTLGFNSAARFGYLSDSQIHWEASLIKVPHSSYKSCPNEQAYRYFQFAPPSATLKAIIVCNLHARELISSQICLNWLKQMNSTTFASKYKLQLFLIANKNRQKFIDDEISCERKNENGVDLNRNFPTDFDHFHIPKTNEIYPGSRPIDQPFTICLNRLLERQRVDLFLDVHSGMNDNAFYQQGRNNLREVQILRRIKHELIPSLRITTLKQDKQPINGHIFADLKVRKHISYSLLFQTFLQSHKQCFLSFNPIGENKNRVVDKYVSAFNRVFESVAHFQIFKALSM